MLKIRKKYKKENHWDFEGIPETFRAGQSFTKWINSDNKNNCNPNWDIPIAYEFNSYGYRSVEFKQTDNFTIACFGCSWTFGIGVPLEYTWQHLLKEKITKEKNIDVDVFNFGWPAVSSDFISRVLHSALYEINPDLILVLFPSISRREVYADDGRPIPITPARNEYSKYYEMLVNDFSSKNNFLKNFYFIKSFLQLKKIPWLFSTWAGDVEKLIKNQEENYAGFLFREPNDFARDNKHPSIKTYNKLVNMFMEKMDNNNYLK